VISSFWFIAKKTKVHIKRLIVKYIFLEIGILILLQPKKCITKLLGLKTSELQLVTFISCFIDGKRFFIFQR